MPPSTSTTLALPLAVVLFVAPATGAEPIDVGLAGFDSSSAVDINGQGQMLGWAWTTELETRSFLYESGVATDLGSLGGGSTWATDINEQGVVVGYSKTAGGQVHAFVLAGGVMTDLGTLGGAQSFARALNDAGQIIGHSETATGGVHAFLYDGGVMNDLGTLGGDISYAVAINESGEIAGHSHTVPGTPGYYSPHAYHYTNGTMTDLGTLGGLSSHVVGLNDQGHVVGYSETSRSNPFSTGFTGGIDQHGFVFSGGAMIDLGRSTTVAVDINESGHVVARQTGTRSFLYSDGTLEDLGNFGASCKANAMNEAGQIVGQAYADATGNSAFVYSGGSLHRLRQDGFWHSEALRINENGQIIGNVWSGSIVRAFLREPECGDGIVDPGEQCDDGATAYDDCCANDCTYPGPRTTCLDASATGVRAARGTTNARDSLRWTWSGDAGGADVGDLGDPSSTTTYTMCISDSSGGVDRLVAAIPILPGARWSDETGNGWTYDDRVGSSAGVTAAAIRFSDNGRISARVTARGANIPMPPPFSDAAMFEMDGRLTVQMFGSASPVCWSSSFTTAAKNTPRSFKATMR